MYCRKLAVLMLLIGLSSAHAAQPDIWRLLRAGGHVLLLRHAEVDTLSRSTSPDADFDGCEGQFNLTETGRAQSLLLGNALRKRSVPIGAVLAGPLCRTRDTARIAFGGYRVLNELEPLPEEAWERTQRIDSIAKVIADYAGPDNFVLVTHQPNIDALALEQVDPATLVVLKPDRKGGFRVVRVLRVDDWKR